MNVPIRCTCPPKADGAPRHDADNVTLRDKLDFRTRLALRQTIKWANTKGGVTEGEVFAILTEAYLLHCIDAWSLVDEKGKPVPPSRENIATFLDDHVDEGMAVADAADGLYTETVLLPLLLGVSSSSPSTSTKPPTSQTTTGQTPHPKRSKRSSTSTTPMAVTGPMQASPAGASS